MPEGARLGDKAPAIDARGCKVCSHIVIGPAVQGSADVIINGKPAVQMLLSAIHYPAESKRLPKTVPLSCATATSRLLINQPAGNGAHSPHRLLFGLLLGLQD